MRRATKMAIGSIIMLCIWLIASYHVNNSIILPNPIVVVQRMLVLLTQLHFYIAICQTFTLVLIAVFSVFSFCFILFVISYRFYGIIDYLKPFLIICRSIPTITLTIVIVFWFPSYISCILICWIALYPPMYTILWQTRKTFGKELVDVMCVYRKSFLIEALHVYIPHLNTCSKSAISFGMGFGCKIIVMAEILGQVRFGIGEQLHFLKQNLDMVGVFAWTLWLICILSFINAKREKLDTLNIFR